MLKRPKTNVQIIQQSALLKNKYYMSFLKKHGQEIYLEVCVAARGMGGCNVLEGQLMGV